MPTAHGVMRKDKKKIKGSVPVGMGPTSFVVESYGVGYCPICLLLLANFDLTKGTSSGAGWYPKSAYFNTTS